jgi:hypothetical protein
MSELEKIARQKSEVALAARLTGLQSEIQATQRELAAKGLFRSGAMLKKILRCCCSALDAQASTVISEYEWAIVQALIVNQSWVGKLIAEASGSLDDLREPVNMQLEQACRAAGQPQLLARLQTEYQSMESAAKLRITLALQSKMAERRRGLIRGLPTLLPKLLSKLFGGSA